MTCDELDKTFPVELQIVAHNSIASNSGYEIYSDDALQFEPYQSDFRDFTISFRRKSTYGSGHERRLPQQFSLVLKARVSDEADQHHRQDLQAFLGKQSATFVQLDDEECLILAARSDIFDLTSDDDNSKEKGECIALVLRTFCVNESCNILVLCSVKSCISDFHIDTQPYPSSISIIEQPDLTLGAHLWDCALILAYHIQSHHIFDDMKKPDYIFELGAGCGLVGLTASIVTEQPVYLTDTEDIVTTATKPNLKRFRRDTDFDHLRINALPLDWNDHEKLASTLEKEGLALATASPKRCVLLASDVLYNTGSHAAFLDTLLAFFNISAFKGKCSAYIGYKRRTAGDDAFFGMAKAKGLTVAKMANLQIGDVQVWRITG